MNIEFDEKNHIYRVDGRVVPYVTGVLREAGLIESAWFNSNALLRGKYVHMLCQLNDEGDLDEASVHPELSGYLSAWRRFLSETGAEIQEIEKSCYNPTYNIAGTPDRIITLNGITNCIHDIKTGGPEKWHSLQTAGYDIVAFPDTGATKRFSIYLGPDGKYKLERHEDSNDIKIFLSAVALARWKNGG